MAAVRLSTQRRRPAWTPCGSLGGVQPVPMPDSSKQPRFNAGRVVLGGTVVSGGGAITVVIAMVLGFDPIEHAIGVAVCAQAVSLVALACFLRRWARQDREATKLFD